MNSALLTICFPVLFSNESHVFTRIEKVYAKNNLKGIELANNYIHRNKSIASPYFFKLNHELEAVENHLASKLQFWPGVQQVLTAWCKRMTRVRGGEMTQ
jgi:glutaredoxin